VARRCVWSTNPENEEAKARYRAVKNTTKRVVTPRKQTNKLKSRKILDFNQIWIVSIDFHKKSPISNFKSVQWELRWYMADRRTDWHDEAIRRFWRLKTNTPKNRFYLCLSWLFPWCFPPTCRATLKWTLISWSGRFTDLGRTGFYRQLCTPVMELCCVNVRNDGLLFQYNAILDFTNNVPTIKMKAIQSWLWRIPGITAWHLLKSCHCRLCCFFVTSARYHCPLFILLLLRFLRTYKLQQW